ncbi:hypothetical protein [Duganella sp. HH105]|uniref:hypothetical protein n=1 Tax=Duganella sp. HH105 TaxID=1781067 RepID=UPI000892AB2A|nr:hypothetical protein [Duganella sp. HH105]OEZ63833.1 hypothetical protein DUGA6_03340 [Duganella sp. HH105]
MRVVCSTKSDDGIDVFLVLEPLYERSDFQFWFTYLNEVKNFSPSNAPSSAQASSSLGLSDFQEAVKGFDRALDLGKSEGTNQYVAYSTFDLDSIYVNNSWKALNIQMCMTVTGHENLPFTTHMGIFASPFRIAKNLPASYVSLKSKLGDKSPLDYFAGKVAAKISILLHSFAIQAYALLNTKIQPQFMVTKPISSMNKIFGYYPNCIAQSKMFSEDGDGLLDAMRKTSFGVGYYVDTTLFTVTIIVRMRDFSLTPYSIHSRASSPGHVGGPTTPSSRVGSFEQKDSRPAIPATTSHISAAATRHPATATVSPAHRPVSLVTVRRISMAPVARLPTMRTTGSIGSSASATRPVAMTTSSTTTASTTGSGTVTTSSSTPASAASSGTVTTSSDMFASIHPASLMMNIGSAFTSDIHPASRPPNMATICRPGTKATAPFLYELAFHHHHQAATVFIDALALAGLYVLVLKKNTTETLP